MKVSLDACLFGAIIQVSNTQSVLDIGTGTGLLALMAAQRCNASIDAIEIDTSAAQQALQNFASSPFSSRLHSHHTSIQNYTTDQQYDCILCNPPFFTEHLQGDNTQRNQARHNDGLSFSELTFHMARLLSEVGSAWVLLPPHEHKNFSVHAQQHGLNLQQHIAVFARENKPSKMGIWHYTKKPVSNIQHSSITIYHTNSNDYTPEFTNLLSDYYLKL